MNCIYRKRSVTFRCISKCNHMCQLYNYHTRICSWAIRIYRGSKKAS
ncbi:unnamed protein product [Amoebophrya sp. A120]|nr:unnamed protein product [Amoebophrya sp. A120]|eukprot:GSA120T00009582001.1